MSSESSHAPSVEELRAAARAQGVDPTDEDLEAVRAFLAGVLPALRGIEERNAAGSAPADPPAEGP